MWKTLLALLIKLKQKNKTSASADLGLAEPAWIQVGPGPGWGPAGRPGLGLFKKIMTRLLIVPPTKQTFSPFVHRSKQKD